MISIGPLGDSTSIRNSRFKPIDISILFLSCGDHSLFDLEPFLLIASKAQFIYLPFDAFQNQNSISFVESILKRKELI